MKLPVVAFVVATNAAVSGAFIRDGRDSGNQQPLQVGPANLSSVTVEQPPLTKTASDLDVQFVINTGDNFYYCGVQSLTDSQFKSDFEDVFTDKSLFVPWYGTLGNHDYAYDVQPQLTYKSPNNDRWQMPDRNYTKRVHLGGSNYATLVFVDTNPCISAYRADDPSGWDPCSGQYGDCEAASDKKCHFHEHILAQNCQSQYDWLKSTLDAIDKNDWIIVAGEYGPYGTRQLEYWRRIVRYGFLVSPPAVYLGEGPRGPFVDTDSYKTIEALVLNKSSRVIPGFRGTPAGMITKSMPVKQSANWSAP